MSIPRKPSKDSLALVASDGQMIDLEVTDAAHFLLWIRGARGGIRARVWLHAETIRQLAQFAGKTLPGTSGDLPMNQSSFPTWHEVQPGDVVLYDGSLTLVEEIAVLKDMTADFWIAHVSGRDLNADGAPGRRTHMDPNAAGLVAILRPIRTEKSA